MNWIWINGEFKSDDEPALSAKDRGFLYGDGLFETLRVYAGEVFQLAEHFARMKASAEFLRMRVPCSEDTVREAADELIQRNGLSDAVLRVALSRGAEAQGLGLVETPLPTLLIQARAFGGFPERIYRRGADLVVASIRQNADSPLPRHKTANYLLYLLARQEARDAGATDAVILNQCGQVCEATVANLFCAKGGRLTTPPVHCGLLPGVTRANVIRIAGIADIEVVEQPLSVADLFDADEIFMTNSLMEIAPVRKIDGQRIGEEVPGPLTRALASLYRDRSEWA